MQAIIEKDHTQLIETVQRRVTKQLSKFQSYNERLRQLNLPTLRYRRIRGDMIEVFKILKYYDSDPNQINTSWGNLSMTVELHQRQTFNDNPYWCSARLEVGTHAIQFLHSWHATADRTSQADVLRGWHNRVGFWSKNMSRFLWENSLLISESKTSLTLFTPDPAQANTRTKIKIADSELPLVRSPKILEVYPDTFFSFNNHCVKWPTESAKETTSWRHWQAPIGDSERGFYWWHIKHWEVRLRTTLHLSEAQILASRTSARYSALRMKH